LHALLAELVPGGIPKEINARSAQRLLDSVTATTAVERARHAIALEHLEDLRRFDEQLRASKQRLEKAVKESGTTVTDLFGVGPYVAAIVIGYTGDVTRFASRDQFAAYTGTAPIEVSSGGRVVHRLSRRGNRQLNHAIHIAAITQIRFAHSPGRAFYDRKVAEGKTAREAVRALKRRISDAIYRQLLHDATNTGPGGQTGTALQSSVTGIEPQQPALRRSHSRTRPNRRTRAVTTAKTRRASTKSRS
jgi:transposase